MELLDGNRNNRILVVDDNEAIHQDFDKILKTASPAGAAGSAVSWPYRGVEAFR